MLLLNDNALFYCFVPGPHPAPKGSKKHVGNGRMKEVSPYLPEWDARLDAALSAHEGAGEAWDIPLQANYLFVMPRPAGHYKKGELKADAPFWHAVRPDKDKLERAVGDALTRNKVIRDDSRISDTARSCKVYGEEPGVHIWVCALPLGGPAEGVRALLPASATRTA